MSEFIINFVKHKNKLQFITFFLDNKPTMKIFAIGMNYPEHNKEVKNALLQQNADYESKKRPVIFTKADSSLLKDGKPFFIPDFMGRIDYETELVVRICKLGKAIPERFAHRYYDAVTVGIDFTARDLQKELRESGQPWDLCKGFDGAAVIGDWVTLPKTESDIMPDGMYMVDDKRAFQFSLKINGETVQEGDTRDMFFSIDAIISYISQYFTLKTGDIIYTGTPVGVGPVKIDDHLEGYLGSTKVLDFNCK